jgi:cold shock CspA family protein
MPGPGGVAEFNHVPGATVARLFNFEVAQDRLKPEHEAWLTTNVVRRLGAGGSIWVMGLARKPTKCSYLYHNYNRNLKNPRLNIDGGEEVSISGREKLKWFKHNRFGFIEMDDGAHLLVHFGSVEGGSIGNLFESDPVNLKLNREGKISRIRKL